MTARRGKSCFVSASVSAFVLREVFGRLLLLAAGNWQACWVRLQPNLALLARVRRGGGHLGRFGRGELGCGAWWVGDEVEGEVELEGHVDAVLVFSSVPFGNGMRNGK